MIDDPENHTDSMMTFLDLKIWIKGNQVRYMFYKKEVSFRYTILKRSALSKTTKHNTCFMEAFRRIRNNSEQLSWDIKSKHLTEKHSSCRFLDILLLRDMMPYMERFAGINR